MVAMSEIHAFAHAVADRFAPERIILFGSHATGTATADSDVDLLVVMPDDGDPLATAYRIRRQIPHAFALDLIVRDPQELRSRIEQHD